MELRVSKKQEAIKDSGSSGGGAYINRSGIYDVTLNYVQVATTKKGAAQLNFNVTHQGMDQTIWGPYLTSTTGDIIEITQGLLNRLCIIAGMDEGQKIETETVEMPVGKDQKLIEMEIIPELSDLPVKMRIQMSYRLYNNEIKEDKVIKAFYREDGATAAEAESGENIGSRLAIDTEKYADNVTYRDGLTEEVVKNWIQKRINGNNSSSKPAETTATKKPATTKRPLFAK